MKVLLDTNAYSDLKRGRRNIADLVRASQRVLLSPFVVGELLYGFRLGGRHEQNVSELTAFLENPYVQLVAVSLVTADRYGRIAAALRRKGTPIPTNDIWIAAQAMETGADLLSSDPHFRHVDGLAWVETAS